GGRGALRSETERGDPDAAVRPAAGPRERLLAGYEEYGIHELAPRLERGDAAPARSGKSVARPVPHRDRQMAELSVERVAENEQIDEREEHRRDHQDRLAPERQIGALADRRDPEERPHQAARRPRSFFAPLHSPRSPRPV